MCRRYSVYGRLRPLPAAVFAEVKGMFRRYHWGGRNDRC
jgi:hypothetical protein